MQAAGAAHAFVTYVGGVCQVPGLRLDWPIQTKKSGIAASSMGVLNKGCTRGRP